MPNFDRVLQSCGAMCAACALAGGAYAQTTPSTPMPPTKGAPVASPNRTAPTAPTTGGGKPAGNSTSALQLVDSTGAVIGRLGVNTAVFTYNGLLTTMALNSDLGSNGLLNSGAFGFPSYYVYFASADCSGQGWVQQFGIGTPQQVSTVQEADGSYTAYVANVSGPSSNLAAGSLFQFGQCYASGYTVSNVWPATSVVPATTFGKPPFYVK